jgi:hypothetical protein
MVTQYDSLWGVLQTFQSAFQLSHQHLYVLGVVIVSGHNLYLGLPSHLHEASEHFVTHSGSGCRTVLRVQWQYHNAFAPLLLQSFQSAVYGWVTISHGPIHNHSGIVYALTQQFCLSSGVVPQWRLIGFFSPYLFVGTLSFEYSGVENDASQYGLPYYLGQFDHSLI